MRQLITAHDSRIRRALEFAKEVDESLKTKIGTGLVPQILSGELPWECFDLARYMAEQHTLEPLDAWQEPNVQNKLKRMQKEREGVVGFPEEVKRIMEEIFPTQGTSVEKK